MRVIPLGVAGVLSVLVLGCGGSQTAAPQQCPEGQYALSKGCGWIPAVVDVGPDLQIDQGAGGSTYQHGPGCYAFHPNPVSVHTAQLVEWRNDTGVSITISTSDGTPLTTVAPGATSGGVFWPTAGTRSVRPSSCVSSLNPPYYADITVTVN